VQYSQPVWPVAVQDKGLVVTPGFATVQVLLLTLWVLRILDDRSTSPAYFYSCVCWTVIVVYVAHCATITHHILRTLAAAALPCRPR
jgi:hypothetical protein